MTDDPRGCTFHAAPEPSKVGSNSAGLVTEGRPKKPHGWQPMTDADLERIMAATLAKR